ncbi:MAG: DUF167 domain-containing protein [Candidatus Komeilibacteria bacterium]|nr:DUF167 domain-containing protein [Candidatus Komeilibacteria bacterium]
MKISVKVIANAKQNKIEELPGGGLKVHLTAIREKNKANRQLVELLAGYYHVSKGQVEIVKGQLISQKVIEIR